LKGHSKVNKPRGGFQNVTGKKKKEAKAKFSEEIQAGGAIAVNLRKKDQSKAKNVNNNEKSLPRGRTGGITLRGG